MTPPKTSLFERDVLPFLKEVWASKDTPESQLKPILREILTADTRGLLKKIKEYGIYET